MATTEQPKFTNPLGTAATPEAPANGYVRERTSSRDYTATDEWDASKTPPSRFQKRKGSIYATPSSRDGHVERNRDAVGDFHKAHSKRWSSISGASSTGPDASQRRKSSTGKSDAGSSAQ
jgi:hypothetical protein